MKRTIGNYVLLGVAVCIFAVAALCGCAPVRSPAQDGNESENGGQTEEPATKPEFASGSGTESDPFIIAQTYQWLNINSHLSSCFELSVDLNMGDQDDLIPIGDTVTPFTGTLDGKGHRIHSAYVTCKNKIAGLFGVISGGTVINLNFSDSQIYQDRGWDAVGSFAAHIKMGAHVENCRTDRININFWQGTCGGFAGVVASASTVRYCSANNVTLKERDINSMVGGLIGSMVGGSVDACWSYIAASWDYTGRVGGILCEHTSGTVSNVFSEISFPTCSGAITYQTSGGCRVSYGICFNGNSADMPLYYKEEVKGTDETSQYYDSKIMDRANSLLEAAGWKDNKLWQKGKLHPELVSYEEYLAIAGRYGE